MGVCFSQTVLIDANPINQMDKRIQKKQGLKTAQQLAEQNNRFADDVDKFQAKVKSRLGPQQEGKWVMHPPLNKIRVCMSRLKNDLSNFLHTHVCTAYCMLLLLYSKARQPGIAISF